MNYTYDFLKKTSLKVGGAFYVFDKNKFIANYQHFRSSIKKYYKNSKVAYSFKANYMPIIGQLLNNIEGIGEVVSRLEYDIALKHLKANKVIFNGPIKTKNDITYALVNGSMINLDSFYEIDFLEDIASNLNHTRSK